MVAGRFGRVTLVGDRTGTFAGEIWQTGVSFVAGDAGGVFPDAIRETLPQFAVTAIGAAEQDATWTIDWAWDGDVRLTQNGQRTLATKALDFWNLIKPMCASTVRLTAVKIAAYSADPNPSGQGRKIISGHNVFTLKAPVQGGLSTASQLPPQIALVASLRTGSRGPRGRGRMYLPTTGSNAANGVVDATTKTTNGPALKAFLEDLWDLNAMPAVVNPGPLTYSSITDVRIGSLFDVQRRRREALDEVYQSYPPVYA